jgi:hypothetical protein
MVQFFSDQNQFAIAIQLFQGNIFARFQRDYPVVFMNKFRSKSLLFQSAKSLKKKAKVIDFFAISSGSGLTKFNYKGRRK